MPFLKIEGALQTCQAHLDSVDSDDPDRPEIESYLVSSIILLIISEYEELIRSIFVTRVAQCGDVEVASFVKEMITQSFRSPDLKRINEMLKKFDPGYRDRFWQKVEQIAGANAAWDNIMKARHAVVHKAGPMNLTLLELSKTYPKTKKVVSELKAVLGVK